MHFLLRKYLMVILSMAIVFLLASCEGGIQLEGHVYSRVTKQPIEKVQVILILKNNDTVKNDRPIDTSDNQFNITDLSKFIPSYTDSNGFFLIRSPLLGCTPKCPDYKLVFAKEGYKMRIVKEDEIKDTTFLEGVLSKY